jgi:hypothetical protein
VSFLPITLCNLIASVDDGSLWEPFSSVGGWPSGDL